MFKLAAQIHIGSFNINQVVDIEVKSSWDSLTDTCVLILPSEVKSFGKMINLAKSQILEVGQRVIIKLGYGNNLNEIFRGFISKVEAGSPTKVHCECAAWLLKIKPYILSYENVSLAKILQDISPIEYQCPDIQLGEFRITNATPAQVLDELRKVYKLPAWTRLGKLYVGLAYWAVGSKHQFIFEKNIVDSSSLIYKNRKDIKIKIKGISIQQNNTKIEYERGDDEGQIRTLNKYNISYLDLKKIVDLEFEKLNIDGFEGEFVAFGEPLVKHGDVIVLIDEKYNRQGKYLVRSVIYAFGQNGFRQTIKIDKKL